MNFDQILDVFDCTDAGRIPRHPRIRLLQRESTSNWAAFNEDALIDPDICRPEDPDGDAELGLADDPDESNDESLGVLRAKLKQPPKKKRKKTDRSGR